MLHNSSEKVNSQGRINEKEQKHEGDEVGDLWQNINQSIQDDFDVGLLSHKSDNSHDPESSDDYACGRESFAQVEHVHHETNIRANNNDHIK